MAIAIEDRLAKQIVDAIREVVDKDINFIDKEGKIIASTDPKRVGTFHEAGYEAQKTGKMIAVTKKEDYQGTKWGVNYPITIGGEVIGVIGITGDPKKTKKFGFLASKITEIFIKEAQINRGYESRKKWMEYLMKLCLTAEVAEQKIIQEILFKLGIEEDASYDCIVLEMKKKHSDFGGVQSQILHLLDQLEIEFVMYMYPNKVIIFIAEHKKNEMQIIEKTIKKQYHRVLYAGQGTPSSLYQIKYSYEEALAAIKHAKREKKTYVKSKDLDIELLIENIPKERVDEYVQKILRTLEQEEKQLLKQYYNCNMSLKNTASKMYIHKNTVQYRLEKIYQKTGRNPRNFEESVLLYTAILLEDHLL